MNLFARYRDLIEEALAGLSAAGRLPPGLDLARVTVAPPRDEAHGDLATNAALALAGQARRPPRELAETIAGALARLDGVARAEVAGPGFVNLTLGPGVWARVVEAAAAAGAGYGRSRRGAGRRVNVEYVSANPTGPMHVGHARGAVFGDALANLLAFAGYDVTREYYINDAGAQIDALARSTFLRYREALGEDIGPIPPGLYPGAYLAPVGAALAARDGARWRGAGEAERLAACRDAALDAMMTAIRGDLAALGVRMDRFSSERALVAAGAVADAVAWLEQRELVYTGTLEPPRGKTPDDWEPRPQTLFRATRFGDDLDRPLRKSDGGYTYFATDIAYHKDKFDRGFTETIDVWGADHAGYVKRMKAAVAAVTERRGALDVKLCRMVNLLEDGAPVKMSKRAGTFVSLRDVVDKVGRDVVRFIMLTRRNDAPLDFDFARVTERSRDNPVFYVQYAHARIRSVQRNAAALDAPGAETGEAALERLTAPEERALIRMVAGWPREVEEAAAAHEPHRVAFFLCELAARFHALWNRGNEDPALRFILPGDPPLCRARLAMLEAVRATLAAGLGVVGAAPAEEM